MERTVKMDVIGCGPRGRGLIKTICACKEAEIVAVCDTYQDRVDSSIALIEEKRGNTPLGYTDSDQLLANKDVEAVLISAGWEAHLSLAVASMKAGKATALEVSGMFSLDDCWELVNVYEQTKTPLMFMENCCYDISTSCLPPRLRAQADLARSFTSRATRSATIITIT